ncbi:hypothetical protein SK128_003549, partial [Halocaridina rubra]
IILVCGLLATSLAAPQFDVEQPTPYEFEYGVNVEETGDVKEHKESVSPSGRTEGEYRWLQPNGLFMVVRYYVDGDSGFVAEVSEEPGTNVEARYRNSLSQETRAGNGAVGLAKSFDVEPSLGAAVNVISAPRPSLNRQPTFRPTPQVFATTQRPVVQPAQVFTSNFNTQRQQSFSSNRFNQQQQQSFTSGNFIDGGIIDGGIIDGGIIDGGIIDGGIINDDFFDDDSREVPQIVLGGLNRFRG